MNGPKSYLAAFSLDGPRVIGEIYEAFEGVMMPEQLIAIGQWFIARASDRIGDERDATGYFAPETRP